MEIEISLAGGKRVEARVQGHVVQTDQPTRDGGEDSAPRPFDLFLASLATCAGYFALEFCQTRGVSTEGILISQVSKRDPSIGMISEVEIIIQLPDVFPERLRQPLIRAVEACSVKKHIERPPQFVVRTKTATQPMGATA